MERRLFIDSGMRVELAAIGVSVLPGAAIAIAALSRCKEKMNILVLTGSPGKYGNSSELATQFIRGVQEAGHTTFRFDCAQSNVHPCIACNSCGMDGPCVFKDDF